MIIQKAALRPVPEYAVVPGHVLEELEVELDEGEVSLQDALDQGFNDFDRRQEVLATALADELASAQDELVQSLGYFLVVTVYVAFREAFPRRLNEVDEDALRMANATLTIDEELRAGDATEVLDSDDLLAMSQPAVLSFIQHHIDEAIEQADGQVDLDELERIYRSLLVLVIALSHAVTAPAGADSSLLN